MKERTLTWIGVAIIVLLLGTTIFEVVSNSKKKRNLIAEKILNESLLSEKQQVQNDLDKFKNDYSVLKSKNDSVNKLLMETESKLAEREKRISNLSRENTLLLNEDKKELEALQKTKTDLDKEVADLKLKIEGMTTQYNDLQNSMTVLETEKNDLDQKLQKTETYDSDNFLVFGSRGKKERLAYYACRVKKLNVNFDVPQSLTEAISFKIVTPTGKEINPEDKSLSWYFAPDSRNMTASLSAITGNFEKSRQVALSYTSTEKLAKGEYKIQVLSNGNIIGNCRIRLK